MTTETLTLTEFLLARIAEDEEGMITVGAVGLRHGPARVLAECEAKRAIVEFHKSWPVMVQMPLEFDRDDVAADLSTVSYRMSQRIAWLTTQEYRKRFGDEPPSGPMLLALAAVYADHPDYREDWRP